MSPPRIELKQLASFVLACQNATVAETARQLGVSPSTLSVALHRLERDLDMQLFLRQGAHLRPLPAAFWLFQQAVALLHAESAARQSVRRRNEPAERVHVRLDLSFTIGRFSKAVSRTVEALHDAHPEISVDFDFVAAGTEPRPAGPNCTAEIEIGYFPPETQGGTITLLEDDWVGVTHSETSPFALDPGRPLAIVRMRETLTLALEAHALRHGLVSRLKRLDARPADLSDLLANMPDTMFLMPRSMMADRLGLGRCHVEPLEPVLISAVSARGRGHDRGAALIFLQTLRRTLAAPEANAVFFPELTARQLRYFSLIERVGGISAAARAANVSQPTLSFQLQRMEAVLADPLFERKRSGAVLTAAGRHLLPLAHDIEQRLERIVTGRQDVTARTQSTLTIGLLPSSGHDSAMTAQVAAALLDVRRRHPQTRFRVFEGANADLHALVRSGEVNLAVVGSVLPGMPHIVLGPVERLSVVAHPSLGLDAYPDIGLAQACALPLVLGPRHLSIHRMFFEAAAAARQPLQPAMDVGSLPLAIALTRGAALATVLPASSVRQDVREGRLTATPIRERLGPGSLSIIFSGERTLAEIEREVVRALATAFGTSTSELLT